MRFLNFLKFLFLIGIILFVMNIINPNYIHRFQKSLKRIMSKLF